MAPRERAESLHYGTDIPRKELLAVCWKARKRGGMRNWEDRKMEAGMLVGKEISRNNRGRI
jgi:hypothetical protein